MVKSVSITNEEAMKAFAVEMAEQVQAGDVLLLKGNLGAGKTTFTKYFAAALGVDDMVTSPTFTVIAEYVVRDNKAIKELVHADLYRFQQVDTVALSSLQEMWIDARDEGRIVVIEWPEKLGDKVPSFAWQLEFLHGETEEKRIVKIDR